MPLTAGTELGPYEIVAPIGAGGMGEVYKARDTRLDRIVAIKLSKEQFSERFDREARAVAALNHPNICTLFDVGPNYLVMEYIEGPTLAERIQAGAIPLAEALPIARQIAEALEAAHEKGIVHRDLKPANIKLTPEGKVKVLDFGLAKAFDKDTSSASDPTNSPTLTISATRAGVILGTAGYMSPEQARGHVVDKRADIWSYGVVLFEMLTGRLTFAGETVSDTLAAVLRADLNWSALPPDTPPAIRRLLRRCLERDRKQRLPDIADARLEIDEPPEPPPVAPPPAHGLSRWWLAALVVPALAFLLLAAVHFREAPEPLLQTSLLAPEKTVLASNSGGIAISPDGRTLAFVATHEDKTLLWVRRLDSLSARPLPGTDNAYYPFWSPDNRFLAFFSQSKLKKIEVAGGPPQVICDTGPGRGGAWSPTGVIVFAGFHGVIQRVSATGGQTVPLTAHDPAYQENSHYWPSFLPDGRHFLYAARSEDQTKDAICVGSIDATTPAGKRHELLRTAANAIYAPSRDPGLWRGGGGWLLFLRETTLSAQRFDAGALRLEGEVIPVAEGVGFVPNIMLAHFSVSGKGSLVYGRGGRDRNRLVWMSRDGKQSPVLAEPGSYLMPRLSPDATRLAVTMVEPNAGSLDIWQIELAHAITTRFTFHPAADVSPVWSPDGKQIVFSSLREGSGQLYLKAASGAGNEERITTPPSAHTRAPSDWSRDGRYILYREVGAQGRAELWVLPMIGDRKPRPFLQTAFSETQGQFSPDGRWVAYASDESGRYEVYVRSFTGAPAKFQISNNGGSQPRWRGDGKELYYIAADGKMMAAGVQLTGDTLVRETPRVLFGARGFGDSSTTSYTYDVTRDGQRFLCLAPIEGDATQPLTLITNWQAGVKR